MVVQITVKKETSDNEDQEKVDRIMNNHEEDSLQGIVVKTEEVDVEDQETDEIPASQGDVDHNVKNLTIVDMDKISVEQQETAEIPARHRDMSSNMENQEETSEELCVLPSLQKDSESNGVDLMNGQKRNVKVEPESNDASNDSDVGIANLRVLTRVSSILGGRCIPSVNN
ncbi:uncharacterized protein, partial [Hetaerina americana]|uniref:uncharacterized protein n=1 Tax=Hetaerina americana TaxID=62018 RepID=UPI003A7F5D97